MDARPFNLNNIRRAAEERRKAARALTEEARRTHLALAEIFESRAGLFPGASDGSNVIQLRPKSAAAEPKTRAAAPRKKPRRKTPANRSAPRRAG